MTWTHFWDMHSGGDQKLTWAHVFIEAEQDRAIKLFMEAFGRDPENETCNCCGEDYSISEGESLAQLTGYHRHLRFVSPLGGNWRSVSLEERREANHLAHYLEPGEAVPDGWHVTESAVRDANVEMGLEEFLSDPHFIDFGRRLDVKLLPDPVVAQ